MPLFKAKYGSLGNWGKREVHISRKKILLVSVLIFFAVIFSISKNQFPLPIVQGDYNTSFSHTRTPIFVDTSFTGIGNGQQGPLVFNSLVNSTKASTVTPTTLVLPALIISKANDAIVVAELDEQTCTLAVSDTQSNSFTPRASEVIASGGLRSIFETAIASSSGSDIITLSYSGTCQTGAGFTDSPMTIAADYSGQGGFGVSGVDGASPSTATGTSTITLTTSPGSFVVEIFTSFTNIPVPPCPTVTNGSSQTKRNAAVCPSPFHYSSEYVDSAPASGSHGFSISWNAPGSPSSPAFIHSALELLSGPSSPPSPSTNPNVRWNFNTTCVILNSNANNPAFASFDYSKGTAGSTGNNCSSADIIISKSPANLQTASGRMLEMIAGWDNLAGSQVLNETLVLRTNGTLPSFTESYNPFRDPQARLIWTTTFRGTQTIYIGRDNTKTISQEGLINDLVIQGNSFLNSSSIAFQEQAVLNFTGSTNFMGTFGVASSTTTTNNTASGLQFGEDYYIMARANFNTSSAPTGISCSGFSGNCVFFISPNAPPAPLSAKSFGIWSVPPSCSDPVNKAACSLPTPQPVFQFNPLDPSSWGNAIIKGLLWVFSVAVPLAFPIVVATVLSVIQVSFDFVGNNLGWGPIGTNFVTFLRGLPTLFGSLGSLLGQLPNLVSGFGSQVGTISSLAGTYFPGLTNFLNDLSNGAPLVGNMLGQLALWFPASYMVIMMFFYFLEVVMNGARGFFEWFHVVKWSSLSLFNIFAIFLEGLIDLITAILGRLTVISPGHKFPKIPHLPAGSRPHISFSRDLAFFHDPTAWFFGGIGFVFLALFAGTSSSGLPANAVSNIASMSGLYLTLFGILFMMLLLYIPSFLVMKLRMGAQKME